jgi:hypothetical protein
MKRPLKIFLVVAVSLVALLVVAVAAAAYFLDLDKVVNAQIAEHKPELEKRLGRKVEVGPVSTKLFPTLGGTVQVVRIAADPSHKEDDHPLLEVGPVSFEVSLWEALVSRGKDVRVKSIVLDGLKVNVVRYADGTLSYQDILDRQPPPDPSQPAKPMSEEMKARIRNASIGEIRLGDAEVHFVDHDTPTHQVAEEYIHHLNLSIHDLRLSDPVKIHVDAAIAADTKNFSFDTQVGPFPQDLELHGAPPIGATALKMDKVELARIAPYLGPAIPARITSATADADLKLSGYAEKGTTHVGGFMDVRHIQLGSGKAFDFRVDVDLDADTGTVSLDVKKLDARLGEIQLASSGGLQNLTSKPTFKDFKIHSTTLAPGLLLAYDPMLAKDLPPGAKLEGAATLDLQASGDAAKQTLVASLDLASMDILLPGLLAKPKGTPLGIKVDGDFTGSEATLRSAQLIADALDLVASGTVKNFAAPIFDLQLTAKPFSFDRLARLAPTVREGLQKQNATAQGSGRIDGHLKGSMQNLDAALEMALTGMKLAVPGTTLDGDLTLKASAKGDPNRSLAAELLLDGQQATLIIPGVLNKGPSTPLHLEASITRAGPAIAVKTLDLKLAELDLHADGTLDQASGQTALRVNVAPLDLEKFARTVTAIPAEKARGGKVDVKIVVGGNPKQLATMTLAMDPLDLHYASSDLRGVLNVVNLDKPVVTLKATSNRLDLDQLLGLDTEKDKTRPEVDDPTLRKYTFTGDLEAQTMIYDKTELSHFRGLVKLVDGVLTVERAGFSVFGGTVSADGTTAEIWRGKMPFHAKLAVKNIDVNSALTAKTKYAALLQGKGDFGVDLSGVGFTTKELEQSLTGDLDAALLDGHYNASSLTQAVVGGFQSALSAIPGLKLGSVGTNNAIRDLAGSFAVKDGKMELKKPMSLNLDGSPLTLAGAIGIAGDLFLKGNYGLPGKVLESASGGRCKVAGQVPVPVEIRGTALKPQFIPDVAGAVQNVVRACLTGQAEAAAQQAVGQARAQAEAKVREVTQQAEAQARAQADALKAQAQGQANAQKKAAEDAVNNARSDGEARTRAAEEQAKKKAKDALGGIHF